MQMWVKEEEEAWERCSRGREVFMGSLPASPENGTEQQEQQDMTESWNVQGQWDQGVDAVAWLRVKEIRAELER